MFLGEFWGRDIVRSLALMMPGPVLNLMMPCIVLIHNKWVVKNFSLDQVVLQKELFNHWLELGEWVLNAPVIIYMMTATSLSSMFIAIYYCKILLCFIWIELLKPDKLLKSLVQIWQTQDIHFVNVWVSF